jgi:hypothetical protein
MKVEQVAVSTATSTMIKDAVNTDQKVSKQWVKASDALYADGVRPDMLTGKTKIADVAADVREAIVLGLPVADRKLINGEPKAMSKEQKDERKVAQQKIGPYIRNIQKYLTDLMIANGEIEEQEEQEEQDKTPAEKLKVVLETALKIVQGDEDPKGYDPVIMTKLIGQAILIIK